MKYLSIFAGIFLLTLFFFTWGFIAAEHEKFPWELIKPVDKEISAFIKGGEARQGAMDRLKHDLGIRPERMLEDLWKNKERDYSSAETKGLKQRRDDPLLFMDENRAFPPGYIIIWGAFDFEQSLYGAILIDENGRVIHKWIPDPDAFRQEIDKRSHEEQGRGDEIKYKTPKDLPQGFSVFPDGSVVFNDGDPGNGMQRIDFCSEPLWVKLGSFNHSITKQQNDQALWTIEGDSVNRLHKIDADTGKTKDIIEISGIMKSNPEDDILSLRYDDLDNRWLNDRWHFNDAEALPARYADSFEDFNTGDLLLSSRSLNALIVIDPETEKIKCRSMGSFLRQHDPDWQEDGTITVYDNQTRDARGGGRRKEDETPKFSRILSIEPDKNEQETLYNGSTDWFYSRIRGKHQVLPDGSILITSSVQGRVFIADKKGKTVFEFLNRYDDKQSLLVSEAVWVPKDYFDFAPEEKTCGSSGS